jgi:autotransporter passenger strand-loop-strand repeat protein
VKNAGNSNTCCATNPFGTQGSQVQILPLRPRNHNISTLTGTVIGTETIPQPFFAPFERPAKPQNPRAAGGTTTGTQLSGGEEFVAGGTASGTLIGSGGCEYVASGGVAASSTISGGEIEIVSGGTTSGAVTFTTSAGGILRLDASQVSSGTISGFGKPEYLDLSDIAFNSATTTVGFAEAGNNLSGTLTVSDGTHAAHLTLLGQYVTAQFTSATDGHGGTLIGDPPVTGVVVNDPGPMNLAAHRR